MAKALLEALKESGASDLLRPTTTMRTMTRTVES